ncbi:MAG: hypothetical protein U0790_01670 [Isosphaeraceae bacterium]
MTSPARIEANRRNAQRSTGPRTEAGKDKVRLNALKHGLDAARSCAAARTRRSSSSAARPGPAS